MTTTTDTSRIAALVVGIGFCVIAGIEIAYSGNFHGHYDHPREYLLDGVLFITLLGAALAARGFTPLLQAPRMPAALATIGPTLVAIGVLFGMIAGEDPSWFVALGGPGNLMWLIGTVWIGLWAWRTRAFTRFAAVGLALTVPFGIVGAQAGSSVVVGIAWIYIAARVLGPRAFEKAMTAEAQPAN
jgi:hypothetical protein